MIATMPKRLQRLRKKGYVMPQRAIYVGRPTPFGNPFRIESYDIFDGEAKPFPADLWRIEASKLAVRDYRAALIAGRLKVSVGAVRHLLCGKDLVCWCPLCPEHAKGKPFHVTCDKCCACHVDVLGEVANVEAAA